MFFWKKKDLISKLNIYQKKMKIGYLIQSYALGGVDTFLSNLINESSKKNSIKIFYNHSHPNIYSLKKK